MGHRARRRAAGSLMGAALVLALVGLPGPVLASTSTTRYVSPTGSDAGNRCAAPATPCATIAHALMVAAAGDTVKIAEAHSTSRTRATWGI